MKISDRMVSSVPSQSTSNVNFKLLRQYIKVSFIDEKINAVRKQKDQWLSAEKTPKKIAEVKKDLRKCVEGYVAKAKKDLETAIGLVQKGGERIDVVAEALQEYISIKHLLKEIHLPKSTKQKGVSQEKREAEIKRCEAKLEKLNKQKGKLFPLGMMDWVDKMAEFVEEWKKIAPYFVNPVHAGGRYLSKKDPSDKEWLEIYNKLKLGNIPKYRLMRPIYIDGEEFQIHPGYEFERKKK